MAKKFFNLVYNTIVHTLALRHDMTEKLGIPILESFISIDFLSMHDYAMNISKNGTNEKKVKESLTLLCNRKKLIFY